MPKIPTDTAAATTSRTRLLPFATRPNTSCMVSRRKKTRRKKTDGHGVERTRRWTSLEVERIPGIFFMSPAPSLRHFYRLQRLAKKWTNKFILHGYESAFSIWLFFFFIFYLLLYCSARLSIEYHAAHWVLWYGDFWLGITCRDTTTGLHGRIEHGILGS